MEGIVEEKKGRVYWLRQNLKKKLVEQIKNHKLFLFLSFMIFFIALFASRAIWQGTLIALRSNVHYASFTLVWLSIIYLSLTRTKKKKFKFGIPLLSVLLLGAFIYPAYRWDFNLLEYIRLWRRYQTLNMIELSEMPLTAHERLLPLNVVHSEAKARLGGDSEHVTKPKHIRRKDNSYALVSSIEPAYPMNQYLGSVEELFCVPIHDPAPSFSGEQRIKTSFNTGEHLKLGKNVYTNTVKTFMNPLKFWNYEPIEMKPMENDQGKWVQVVLLIKWKGLFFPRPEFGGVHIIDQVSEGEENLLSSLKMMVLGKGKWISPKDIHKYPFLKKQNLIPEAVSRYMAESFRFSKGLLAPLPFYHRGDIRIPDMPGDMNDQPFTTYYHDFSNKNKEWEKLYAAFYLEPWKPDLQGLSTTVLIPSDGIGSILIRRHAKYKESLIGASAVAQKIRASRKNYSWSTSADIAEVKQWIKIIDGKRRKFWMGTVITLETKQDIDKSAKKNKEAHTDENIKSKQIAGTIPEIALVEMDTGNVFWVDPLHPDKWIERIKTEKN